jgi:mannose-6-phosphate isomerase-like protein (cupin superfamily)
VGEHAIATSSQAMDYMADYPGFGEMRSFTDALGAEQLAFTWRSMPPGTGGKGSYGHRHRTQEEVYFVIRGNLAFKVGEEVFEAGPRTAIRIPPHVYRSVHNDGPDEAELVICSVKAGDPQAETETTPDFWPD